MRGGLAMHQAAQPAETAPLRVTNLAKAYAGGRGVGDVSFSVARVAIAGFIGVNGAGKSTTLKSIMGLIAPDAGSIELFGRPASFEARKRLGFLPEERGLAPRERGRAGPPFPPRPTGRAAGRGTEG